jgi:hypothetical protein
MDAIIRFLGSSRVLVLVLLVAGTLLGTRHNDFAFYTHPDESGKVLQIQRNSRNFNHPMALLTTTTLLTGFQGKHLSPQAIVVAGRWTSAFFCALAVALLAVLARRMAGPSDRPTAVLAGWLAGVFGLMNPLTFELAHYMKEDPSYACGVAATFLALHWFWERRDENVAGWVGAAAGLAASGKYLGWLLLPLALAVVLLPDESEAARLRRFRAMMFGFWSVWVVLNYPFFNHPSGLFKSLNREMGGVVAGHRGNTIDVPHRVYWNLFWNTPKPVLLGFGCWAAAVVLKLCRAGRSSLSSRSTLPEALYLGFALGLAVMMSFSPKAAARYFLPVSMAISAGAGVGVVLAGRLVARSLRAREAAVAVVTLAWGGWGIATIEPLLDAKMRGFAWDDREVLRAWVEQNLPASAVIAQDARVNLPDPETWEHRDEPPLAQRLIGKEFVADLGTLDELRRRGITHVAVAKPTYGRFWYARPTARTAEEFARRKAFYTTLGLGEGGALAPGVRLVWEQADGPITYLQPGLKLFEIAAVR